MIKIKKIQNDKNFANTVIKQFIHPFEDGNGRIARADGTKDRFYSLSSQIESERKHYYNELERQQRATPGITSWLSWFLGCLGRAIGNAKPHLGMFYLRPNFGARSTRNLLMIGKD